MPANVPRKALWRHASLRRVLLCALIVLGGWGFFLALFQVSQSWKEYDRNRRLAEWAFDAGQIMLLAQHLAFERGRTAVLLRSPAVATGTDLAFIAGRRAQADQVVAVLQERVAKMPDVDQGAFRILWPEILALRRQADRDLVLPLARRDAELTALWVEQTTQMLERISRLSRALARHYGQGEEVNRLSLLSELTYRLRMTAGAEASMIAQRVANREVMDGREMHEVFKLRGQQEAVWSEIDSMVDYGSLPALQKVAADLKLRQEALRHLQDAVLESWSLAALPISRSATSRTGLCRCWTRFRN